MVSELHVLVTFRYANVLFIELEDMFNVTLGFLEANSVRYPIGKKTFHKIFHTIKTLLIVWNLKGQEHDLAVLWAQIYLE